MLQLRPGGSALLCLPISALQPASFHHWRSVQAHGCSVFMDSSIFCGLYGQVILAFFTDCPYMYRQLETLLGGLDQRSSSIQKP